MSIWAPWLVIGLPLAGAGASLFLRAPMAGWAALGVTIATMGAALALPWHSGADALVRVDGLAIVLALLVAAAGLLAAWRGAANSGPAVARALLALAALELTALSNALAVSWVALTAAVLAVLLGARGAAAWRAAMTVLPALGLLLFGLVLLGHAAGPGAGQRWDALAGAAPRLDPALVSLGFILTLPGLAACAGLAPLHLWQRAAGRSTGPAALLLPAIGAVALGMLLRVRAIVLAQPEAVPPGPALLALGLASLAWAALTLWRRGTRNEQGTGAAVLFASGLASAAFGLGGAAADAAGLLLIVAAVLLAPLATAGGWARAAALSALALLPPFAPFGAGLALLGAAMEGAPLLALPLVGLMAAAASGLARQAVDGWRTPAPRLADCAVAALVLALVLAVGVVPSAARWFAVVAEGLR